MDAHRILYYDAWITSGKSEDVGLMQNMIEPKKRKNAFWIISTVVMVLTVLLFAYVLLLKINGQRASFFGYTLHIVVTDSMSPEINVGDFVVAKETAPQDIKINDYIVFESPDPALKGKTIIHSVVKIENNDGVIEFTTQGVKEGAPVDNYPVREIIGRFCFKSAFIGKAVLFLTNGTNLFFIALSIVLIWLIIFFFKRVMRLLKQVKKG